MEEESEKKNTKKSQRKSKGKSGSRSKNRYNKSPQVSMEKIYTQRLSRNWLFIHNNYFYDNLMRKSNSQISCIPSHPGNVSTGNA